MSIFIKPANSLNTSVLDFTGGNSGGNPDPKLTAKKLALRSRFGNHYEDDDYDYVDSDNDYDY